ncbi:MAG: murein biosynthesis integral membrane protein MurJ [Bacillota bacterium]|jgi:putative peptidoglycan lipid II flippase
MSQNTRVVKAAGFIMVAMVISRILGYLRDVIIYAQFGQNRITDAYNAAFSIPDFLYMLLVGGALSSSFIPVFSSYIATDREKEGWEVASVVINVVFSLMTIGIIIGYLFTPQLIYLLVPGFDAGAMNLTVFLTRIMFLQVVFMSLSGISMGILHSYKHFTSPAIGSVLYNLGIIFVGVICGNLIESVWPGYGIAGFSIGVVIGAAANFAVQVPALLKIGLKYRFSFNIFHPGVVKLGKLMVPILIGLSVSQVNLFVNQNLASSLPAGIVAALRTGQRLMQLPIGIFAIAIAVAVFPTLTGHAAKKERDEFKKTTSLGFRSVVFITLPAAVGLAVLRVPIIRFMFEFEGGKFTNEATLATADALLYYCIGLFAYSAIHVLSRVFYALQDTLTPVLAGILAIVTNIGLSLLLIHPMQQGGLALAYSLAGILNMGILLILLRRKIGPLGGWRLLLSLGQTIFASFLMGWVVFYTAKFSMILWGTQTKLAQLAQVSLSVIVGALIFALVSLLFKMEEAELVGKVLFRRFRRKH